MWKLFNGRNKLTMSQIIQELFISWQRQNQHFYKYKHTVGACAKYSRQDIHTQGWTNDVEDDSLKGLWQWPDTSRPIILGIILCLRYRSLWRFGSTLYFHVQVMTGCNYLNRLFIILRLVPTVGNESITVGSNASLYSILQQQHQIFRFPFSNLLRKPLSENARLQS
jgi:hypothetical protein